MCQVFYPDTSSTSQLFGPLLEKLAEGNPVLVLSGYPGRTEADCKPHRSESVNGIEIRRSGLSIDYRRNFLLRALSYAAFLSHLFLRLLFMTRTDVVIGVSNPPFTAQVLWLASRVRRFGYIYMLHDAYPEGLFALGKMQRSSMLAKIWLWTNRRSYHAARKLIVLGRDTPPMLNQNYEIGNEKCCYIPHWSPVEVDNCQTVTDISESPNSKLREQFVVQYSGNMGIWNDMLTIVQAAKLLAENGKIHFSMIGDGFRRAEAESLSQQLGLKNISWQDFVPLEQLAESLASCHVSIISQNHGLEGVAVPCKLYGILASGRAIVAQVPRQCEVALTVQENSCGYVVEPQNAVQLAETIQSMSVDMQTVEDMGKMSFEAYRNNYRLAQAVESFESVCGVTREAASG